MGVFFTANDRLSLDLHLSALSTNLKLGVNMIKPDWKNSILNVSATLSQFLGNSNDIPKVAKLNEVLSKGYDTVVYICFDGLGMYPLQQNLPQDSFLRRHVASTITSVFPSTTTNATTTLKSATYPSQHGLFGWSLYFDELKRCVDIYWSQDSYTEQPISSSVLDDYMKCDFYFDSIKSDYTVTTIFPPYITRQGNNYNYQSMDEMFSLLESVTRQKGKNFIYCYCGQPDSTMHEFGVTSKEAQEKIIYINDKVEELAKGLKNAVVIITPDHGQTDITDYIKLYEDEELKLSLTTPFYLEARAVAFRVKDEDAFLKAVSKYQKDATLYKVSDMVKDNFFGPVTDRIPMLGDYILVMNDNQKQFVFSERHMLFKGHHTGLSEKEMLLPLVIAECK